MEPNRDIPLVIFAKAPILDQVKTRLQPQLTPRQCTEVAQLLLQITIHKAVQYWPGEIILSAGLDARHPFLTKMATQHQLRIETQADGDLGQRMHHAMQQFGYPAAIIGSDIPQINQHVLKAAHTHLSDGDNVIGPSDDGGYYLIGLAQANPALFEQISWGGDKVLDQTLEKARILSLQLQQLNPINDVDTWFDLHRAAKEVPELQVYLDSLKLVK